MMFEMLAGVWPFVAESLTLLLAKHVNADTPLLPLGLAHLRPMHKQLERRYASAAELPDDMKEIA